MKPYHSRGKDDWGTPQALFDYFKTRYSFGVDIAASAENTKCDRYLSEALDALNWDWYGVACGDCDIFGNPPYSKNAEFLQKAWELTKWHADYDIVSGPGTFLVLLVPARTDTKWWHDYVMDKAAMVMFIKGRVCFEGAPAGAPFPSAIVIYNPQYTALKVPTMYVPLVLTPAERGFKGKSYEKEDGCEGRSEEGWEEEEDREEGCGQEASCEEEILVPSNWDNEIQINEDCYATYQKRIEDQESDG